MKILITGGTGFIGRPLVQRLTDRHHHVVVLSRNPDKARKVIHSSARLALWDDNSPTNWQDELKDCDAIINLAGENLSAGIWTKKQKARILNSRINAGRIIMQGLSDSGYRPKVLIQASAVGFYGDTGSQTVDETNDSGSGFLADVVRQWENSTSALDNLGIRRIIIRTGLVLSNSGGLLQKLKLPYNFFIGGYIGRGTQGFPWIHLDDELKAILFLLEQPDMHGIFNLSSPNSASAREFAAEIGKILKRPAWLSIPSFLIKMIPGEMGEELLLKGQYVKPRRLLETGFTFHYPNLQDALRDAL